MRLVPIALAILAVTLAPLSSFAASGTSVRAIAFVASHEKGATDPRLAPYEATLRNNLRFESFRYTGESSAAVSPGGKSSLSVPGGGHIELQSDGSGTIRAQRGGTAVTLSPGRPAVFMGGPAGKGGVSGVIVMTF